MKNVSIILTIVALLLFTFRLIFIRKKSAFWDAILAVAAAFTVPACAISVCLISSENLQIFFIIVSCIYLLYLCVYIFKQYKHNNQVKKLSVNIEGERDLSVEILEKITNVLAENPSIDKVEMFHYSKTERWAELLKKTIKNNGKGISVVEKKTKISS